MPALVELQEGSLSGALLYEISPQSLNREDILPDAAYRALPKSVQEDLKLLVRIPDSVVTSGAVKEVLGIAVIPVPEKLADGLGRVGGRAVSAARATLRTIDNIKIMYSEKDGFLIAVDRAMPIGPNGDAATAMVEMAYKVGGAESLQRILTGGTGEVQPVGLLERLSDNANSATLRVYGVSPNLNAATIHVTVDVPHPLINSMTGLLTSTDADRQDLESLLGEVDAESWAEKAFASGYDHQSVTVGFVTNIDAVHDRVLSSVGSAVASGTLAAGGVPVAGPALQAIGRGFKAGTTVVNNVTTTLVEFVGAADLYRVEPTRIRDGLRIDDANDLSFMHADGTGRLYLDRDEARVLDVLATALGVPELRLATDRGFAEGADEYAYAGRLVEGSDERFMEFLMNPELNLGVQNAAASYVRHHLAEGSSAWQLSRWTFDPTRDLTQRDGEHIGFRNFGSAGLALANTVNELALAYPETSGHVIEIRGDPTYPGNPFSGQNPDDVHLFRAEFIDNTLEAQAFLQSLRDELGPESAEWKAVVDRLVAAQTEGEHALGITFNLGELEDRLGDPDPALEEEQTGFTGEAAMRGDIEPVFDPAFDGESVEYTPPTVTDPDHPVAREQFERSQEAELDAEQPLPSLSENVDALVAANAALTLLAEDPRTETTDEGWFREAAARLDGEQYYVEKTDDALQIMRRDGVFGRVGNTTVLRVEEGQIVRNNLEPEDLRALNSAVLALESDEDAIEAAANQLPSETALVEATETLLERDIANLFQMEVSASPDGTSSGGMSQFVLNGTNDALVIHKDGDLVFYAEEGEVARNDLSAQDTAFLLHNAYLEQERIVEHQHDLTSQDLSAPDAPVASAEDVAPTSVEDASSEPTDPSPSAPVEPEPVGTAPVEDEVPPTPPSPEEIAYARRLDDVIMGTVEQFFSDSDVDVQQLMEQLEGGTAAAFIAEHLAEDTPDGVAERLESVLEMRDALDDDVIAHAERVDLAPEPDVSSDLAQEDVRSDPAPTLGVEAGVEASVEASGEASGSVDVAEAAVMDGMDV